MMMRIVLALMIFLFLQNDLPAQNQARWTFQTGDRINSSPLVHQNKVMLSSSKMDLLKMDS